MIGLQAGKINEAVSDLEQARRMGGPLYVTAFLGFAYGASGDRPKALAVIEELNHKSVQGYVPPFNLAAVYVGIGDRERAIDEFDKAYAATSPWLMILKIDRMFNELRSDPRFIVLLKNLQLDQ